MRKLLPPPPGKGGCKCAFPDPAEKACGSTGECLRQEGLLPHIASPAENTFAPCLRPVDSAAIALCPSLAHPKIGRLLPSLRGPYEECDKEGF
jgi:hypothetical protein